MKRQAIVVGAAPLDSSVARKRLKKSLRNLGALRIAVDGGMEIFRALKVLPDLYVGDLDSVSNVPSTVPAVFLPHQKNYSDLKAALEICSQLGVSHVEAWAVTGGRADHHWASIEEMSASLQELKGCRLEAYGEDAAFFWVTPSAPLKLVTRPGTVVSIFNLYRAVGVTTRGLAYNLSAASLHSGSHGLSNYSRSKTVGVSVRKGVALVIVPSQRGRIDVTSV